MHRLSVKWLKNNRFGAPYCQLNIRPPLILAVGQAAPTRKVAGIRAAGWARFSRTPATNGPVPSRLTTPEDIANGADVLLATLLQLDAKLTE